MKATDLINLSIYLIFVAIGIQSVLDLLRYRDATRRDVALLFTSLGAQFLVQILTLLLHIKMPTLVNILTLILLLLEPYLLLRLVRYLRHMPVSRLRVTLGVMLTMVVLSLVFSPHLPLLVAVIMVVYLIGFNGYAMVGFVRGAVYAMGIAQQRLRLAAAGSCFFALLFVIILLSAPLPQMKDMLLLLAELFALCSAITFYLGFAPPRWLRRIWQLAETDTYLTQISHTSLDTPIPSTQITSDLCRLACRAIGGMVAVILQRDAVHQCWIVATVDEVTSDAWNDATVFIRDWDGTSPRYLRGSKQMTEAERRMLEAVGADTLLMIPILTTQGIWGLLLVFLQYGSLFIEDDLHFLQRMTEQSAIVLDNMQLIENLRHYAYSLEERTIHLTAANRELDAFSYSVSHDLRAPLRAVDGFSQALLEDYEATLDESGQDFLHRIRTESQRMGQLIDDLIGLSRLTRTEMTTKEVDLSQVVREIASSLAAKEPERTVALTIQRDVTVLGDERLLRVALENLIGNAWKFTAKQPQAHITFGCVNDSTPPEYFIRDNGAGFDMAYVSKLFGPFQRLHAMEEFAGTGIGLATVQRIFYRHGGAVRAEGTVGEGATFFFHFGAGSVAAAEGDVHESYLVSRR